jgi:quinoprotein glucose dehydrogenase
MYVVGKEGAIVALDAAAGKEIWSHPPTVSPNRGFNYWESKDRKDRWPRQLAGRSRPKTMGEVQPGTPGRVFENLIILGSAPGEGYVSPPGDLHAL